MVTKKKVIPIYSTTTCENCVYCIEVGDDTHHCYYNPPIIVVIDDHPYTLHPEVDLDDHICGSFKGKH